MINVLVIDDHPVVIAGVRSMMRKVSDEITVIDGFASVDALIQQLVPPKFDVVLLDLYLADTNPVENLFKLKKTFPGKPVIIFTSEERPSWKRKMMQLGAHAYMMKSATLEEICFTLKKVAEGNYFFIGSADVSHEKEAFLVNGEFADNKIALVKLLAEGLPQSEIAKKLDISVSNVEKNLRYIRNKLGITSNVTMVRMFIENGLI
jgi:DNA-binding NarL/FixJ family response regulator